MLGSPGGYYVDASQTMDYNGLQAALRKRFSNHYSFDVNYTFGKGVATQGGDLAVYSLSNVSNTQEFYDPEFDQRPDRQRPSTPPQRDVHRRAAGDSADKIGSLKGVAGGWQVSGIVSARSGNALTITQPSGLPNSRPDVVPGVDLVIANWKDTCDPTGCNYLNPAAFVRVPVVAATNATIRPGNYEIGDARSPAEWDLHTTFAKNFELGASRRLQIRADFFSILNKGELGQPGYSASTRVISGASHLRGQPDDADWRAVELLKR